MRKIYKVWQYGPKDKMSDLICDNYPMLLVLNRFGIDLGFADSSIEQVCEQYKIEVNTFLAVVNLLITENKANLNVDPEAISLSALIDYLSNSHNYFREYKLPDIRQQLEQSLQGNNAVSAAVIKYYDEYIAEVEKHLVHEETVVFAYVKALLGGTQDQEYDISSFSEHHESVDSKLSELKNILIKYYPAKTTNELSSVLFDIFACESDLASHAAIEDYLLVPAIRAVENKKAND